MDLQEVRSLIDKIQSVTRWIPEEFPELQFTLNHSQLDLVWFYSMDEKNKNFDSAVAFAQTIPVFTNQDFHDDGFKKWVINDKEHLKYLKATWLP